MEIEKTGNKSHEAVSYLYNKIDQFHFPHFLYLEIGYKKADIISLY